MWRLKIGAETVGDGDGAWMRSVNGHVGRQVWEFCPELGSPEELSLVENARREFTNHRFEKKHSADRLMRIQYVMRLAKYVLCVYDEHFWSRKGYNGSQLWDSAFAVQAIISTDLVEEYGLSLKRAHKYLKDSQNADGGFATYELTRSYQWLEVKSNIRFLTFKPLYLYHGGLPIDTCNNIYTFSLFKKNL
ncbi:cycloartenol synthase-like isoform X1 [Tripterygium wilfordii]|uniref:Cycloartenol synthase-like isoform X1 n=1 Tax=Tripterygium wilfordii TaxID=458696 RepID=A0A7J7BZ85_TRIWF|nr:cycloartenol synthase-like isoform X1 [Tripterygium wilfordii]